MYLLLVFLPLNSTKKEKGYKKYLLHYLKILINK